MTDTARDVIATGIFDPSAFEKTSSDWVMKTRKKLSDEAADRVIQKLRSAGYRILGPGELDNESLEAAAKVCEQYEGKPCGPAELWTEEQRQFFDAGQTDASLSTAAAIRSLKGGSR